MTSSNRYTRVLLASFPSKRREIRQTRLRLAEVRAQLRVHAEGEANLDEIIDYPSHNTSVPEPASPVLVSVEMREKLSNLGYSPDDIRQLTPEGAQSIIDGGLTSKQRKEMAERRVEALDDLEENVLGGLESDKKRIDMVKKRLENATALISKLDEAFEAVETERSSAPLQDQDKLRLKSEWIQGHIERATQAETALKIQIKTINTLVTSVTKVESGLIDELQEANDAALLTPSVEDDDLIKQILNSKKEQLKKIEVLRKKLLTVSRKLDVKMDKLLSYHAKVSKEVDKGDKFKLNEMKEIITFFQRKVDDLVKEQKDVVKEIVQHEDSLRDATTEQRLEELENVLKDLSADPHSSENLKQQAKEKVAPDDVGKDIASKPKKYKQQADAMLAFADTTSQHYGDFILSFLAPDIPSDAKIEKFIMGANSIILRRAQESKALADPYTRNPMYRSAILLVPSLYEFLASTMDGVVSPGEIKAASFQAQEMESLYSEMIRVGMIKEAIGIRDMLTSIRETGDTVKDEFGALVDTTKNIGKGVGDMASSAWDKTKGLGRKVQDVKRNIDEARDRKRFQKDDTLLRRDPAYDLKIRQLNLRQLQELERELQKKLKEASKAVHQFQLENNEAASNKARNLVLDIQRQLKVIEGALKEQEEGARRPSNDADKATALMAVHMPKLQAFLAGGIPNDAKVEAELLRQSAKIADAANLMIKEGVKAKAKYPNLPPTIRAYGTMFLAIDETLQKALRTTARNPDFISRPNSEPKSKKNPTPTFKEHEEDEAKDLKKKEERLKDYKDRGILPPEAIVPPKKWNL